MNKNLILFIVFPLVFVALFLTSIPVFGGNQSSSNPSASSSPPSSASQAQHPSTGNSKKASRTQKTFRKPIEALGWCCQKGTVNRKKITKSECTKQRGTYIPLSSNPSDFCGFCSKNGKITAVTTKSEKNRCNGSTGRFYTSSNLANKNLVWCCSNKKISYVDKNICNKDGGKFTSKKSASFIQECKSVKGYCNTKGGTLSRRTTKKQCIKLKGSFFVKKVHAQRDLIKKKAKIGTGKPRLKRVGQKDTTNEPLSVAKTKQPKKPADRRLAIQENRPDTMKPLKPKSFPEAEYGNSDPLKPTPPKFQVGVDSSRLPLKKIVTGDGTVSSTPNRGADSKPPSPEDKPAPLHVAQAQPGSTDRPKLTQILPPMQIVDDTSRPTLDKIIWAVGIGTGTTTATAVVAHSTFLDEIHMTAIPEPGGPYTAHVTATVQNASGPQSFLHFQGLAAATTYNYKMIFKKGSTEGSYEGSFRTRRRIVKFVIESIRAIDDGDDTSDGDFSFSFCEVGKCEYPSGNPRMDFSHTIGTGDKITVNHYMTFNSVREDSIDIHLSVIESDESFGSRGGSLHHETKSFYFDWVDNEHNSQSKNIEWNMNHDTGDNQFHVKIKGKMVVSSAAN